LEPWHPGTLKDSGTLLPWNPGTLGSRVSGFQGSGVPRFQGSRVPGFQASRVPGPGFQGSISILKAASPREPAPALEIETQQALLLGTNPKTTLNSKKLTIQALNYPGKRPQTVWGEWADNV